MFIKYIDTRRVVTWTKVNAFGTVKYSLMDKSNETVGIGMVGRKRQDVRRSSEIVEIVK